jgi:hypothetical protein
LRHMALAEAPKVVNEPINDFLNQITNDRLINED